MECPTRNASVLLRREDLVLEEFHEALVDLFGAQLLAAPEHFLVLVRLFSTAPLLPASGESDVDRHCTHPQADRRNG